MANDVQKVVIIGAGRIGQTLACMYRQLGIQILALSSRTNDRAQQAVAFVAEGRGFTFDSSCSEHPDSSLFSFLESAVVDDSWAILLCCSDDSCQQVAEQLSAVRVDWNGARVLHCSGGLGLDVLGSFGKKGAELGALHPCYPVFKACNSLPAAEGVCYTYRGTKGFGKVARAWVERWGGEFVAIDGADQEAYHAATVLVAGHFTTLVAEAQQLLTAAGLSEQGASSVAYSVYSGVVQNLRGVSPSELPLKLTGPFVREDEQLIARHREAIERNHPEALAVYDLLGARCRFLLKNHSK